MRAQQPAFAFLPVLGLHSARMSTMQLSSPVPMFPKAYYFQTKPVLFRTAPPSPRRKFRPVWPVHSALRDTGSPPSISAVTGISMILECLLVRYEILWAFVRYKGFYGILWNFMAFYGILWHLWNGGYKGDFRFMRRV